MAMNSVSSEEFSFPSLLSYDSTDHSVLDSPPLWKHSPENLLRGDYNRGSSRFLIGKHDDNDQTKSFSYVETRTLYSDKKEEKMDMLWEDLNQEDKTRSQSLRIDSVGEKKTSVFSKESTAVAVGCGTKLTSPRKNKKKMMRPNVLMLMRALKKFLVLPSVSHRSPAKTHPR